MRLKYPEWQRPYEAALLEFDAQKLAAQVHEAEMAILSRLLELRTSLDGYEERVAIEDACKGLLAIKTNILEWPSLYSQPNESQAAPEPD